MLLSLTRALRRRSTAGTQVPLRLAVALLAGFLSSAALLAQTGIEGDASDPTVLAGETLGLGSVASMVVPEGAMGLSGSVARQAIEAAGNLPDPLVVALLMPTADGDEHDWSMVFSWEPVGYVEDEEEIDADALLEAMQEGNEEAQKERTRLKLGTLSIEKWHTEPKYNRTTRNLEWGLLLSSDGSPLVNHEFRILARHGVLSVTLVSDIEDMEHSLPEARRWLESVEFKSGEAYSEYRSGDKIAEYGLTGLIAGGALAVALKTGFLARFWKFILAGVAAVVAGVAKIFKKSPKATGPGYDEQ